MSRIFLLSLVICLLFDSARAQIVEVGQGTQISVFSPLCRTRDYCVYEIIYLASDISASGVISRFGFEREDGTNTDSIENVSIYMKQTALTQLQSATYSDTGYTLVFSGSFPNDAGSGWRTVTLNQPFAYDGISNLMVLTVKGYQPAIANTPVTPRWLYTDILPDPDRARRYFGNVA